MVWDRRLAYESGKIRALYERVPALEYSVGADVRVFPRVGSLLFYRAPWKRDQEYRDRGIYVGDCTAFWADDMDEMSLVNSDLDHVSLEVW